MLLVVITVRLHNVGTSELEELDRFFIFVYSYSLYESTFRLNRKIADNILFFPSCSSDDDDVE